MAEIDSDRPINIREMGAMAAGRIPMKTICSLVRVDGFEVTRGYSSWVLVESVQEIQGGE